jgi:hypothetical protein
VYSTTINSLNLIKAKRKIFNQLETITCFRLKSSSRASSRTVENSLSVPFIFTALIVIPSDSRSKTRRSVSPRFEPFSSFNHSYWHTYIFHLC